MMLPLISIIIPAYNCERFIGETLQSVIDQTYKHFEVLVVDDGSTDKQREVVNAFVAMDDRIKYFYQDNQGVSAARNNGFRQCRGELIAFLDSDDVWLPENLQLKMSKFREDDFGLVHSDATIIDEWSHPKEGVLKGNAGYVLDALLSWDGTQIPGPSSTLIKRDVLDTMGLFDEKLSTTADKDLFIRIASCFKIGRVDQVTWQYRIHSHNMHRNIRAMEADVLRVYEKARKRKLFKSRAFEKQCFSTMYLVLSATWAGDGKNPRKSIRYLLKALKSNPFIITSIIKRALNRWVFVNR